MLTHAEQIELLEIQYLDHLRPKPDYRPWPARSWKEKMEEERRVELLERQRDDPSLMLQAKIDDLRWWKTTTTEIEEINPDLGIDECSPDSITNESSCQDSVMGDSGSL
jgi:hypothetical protein